MSHDPRLVKDEDQIEALRSAVPDWIKRLDRPATPCVVPAFGPLEGIRVVGTGQLVAQPYIGTKLAEFGVACVSGWYSGRLAWGEVDLEIDRCAAHMEKLRHNGCRVVVYGEVAGSIQGQIDTPLAKRPRFTTEEQWLGYAQRLNAFGEHLKAAYGITLAYHHHMGAYIEAPADIDRLMAETDPQHVGLLFDTGHAYYGGAEDPVALLKKHVARVVHVHCKDVRPQVIA